MSGRTALARLARSRRVRTGLAVLACWALAALFAEWIAADHPLVATGADGLRVVPSLVAKSPGASPDCEGLRSLEEAGADGASQGFAIWPAVRSGPWCAAPGRGAAAPSWRHPLGTDGSGRDVLARLLYGARTALGFGVLVVLVSLLVGGGLGALAGLRGGAWDELLARPVELVQSVPQIVVVAVAAALRPDRAGWVLVAAVVAVRWAEMARLVRAEVLRLLNEQWFMAARAMGCSPRRLLVAHLLPNLLGPVAASAAFSLGSVVLLEVAVSFLGLGLSGSWGGLIAEGVTAHAPPWAAVAAIISLATVVGAAHLVGDGVCDVLDARVAARLAGRRVPGR